MGTSQSSDAKSKTYDELQAESSKYFNEFKQSGLLDKFILISNTQYSLILYEIFRDSNVLDTVEISYFIDKMLPSLKGAQAKLNTRLNNGKKGGSNTIPNANTIKKTMNSRCVQYKFSNWNNIYKKLINNKTNLIKILDSSINKIKKLTIDKTDAGKMISAFKISKTFKILKNITDPSIYFKICIILNENAKLSISEISYFMEYILGLFINDNFETVHKLNMVSDKYTYVNFYNILNKIVINDEIISNKLTKNAPTS